MTAAPASRPESAPERLTRVLSRAALHAGLDLGDERQAHEALEREDPAEVALHFEAALELARSRAQQNLRFDRAAAASLGAWAAPVAIAAAAEGPTCDMPTCLGLLLLTDLVLLVAVAAMGAALLARLRSLRRPARVVPNEDADAVCLNGEGR